MDLHKELKVSRVDCVDAVDHISQTSQGRFRVTRVQAHRTRLDQELLFLLAVTNCCIQEVYVEYYGIFLRCCGFLWLVSAFCSFLDRRPPQNLSVVQLVRLVRVVNGCKWM